MGAFETLCITCGQPAGDPPRLNVLESGENCPSCALRALESVPAALPIDPSSEPAHRRWALVDYPVDEEDEGSFEPPPGA